MSKYNTMSMAHSIDARPLDGVCLLDDSVNHLN